MNRLRLLAVSALAFAATFSANSLATAQTMQDMAQVRVVHASPDAPAVDIWLNDTPAIRGLAFGQFTGHTSVPAGNQRVRVAPTGGQPDSAVIDATLELAAGQAYTVLATGRLAEIKPLVLTDERQAADSTGSRVRFVHASPGAPAVDIAVAGGPRVFSNVPFGEGSSYLDIPAGTLDLQVRVAGTDTTVLTVPGATFAPGYVYTLVAAGLASGQPPLQALAMSDRSESR